MLTGCSQAAARLLKAAAAPLVLSWRPWYSFPHGNSPDALSLMQEAIAPWLSANPGVRIRLTTLGYQEATLASMLAGLGPDVIEDWVLPLYLQDDLLLDLTPFVRRDNVELGIFVPAVVQYLEAAGRGAPGGPGLFALPAYTHTLAMVVNLGLLDDLGLSPPVPDWGYREWTRLWEAVTQLGSGDRPRRYGAQLSWLGYDYWGGNPAPFYLRGFGGEYADPADSSRCALDWPGSVACLEWAYGLLRAGVIGGGNVGSFGAGQQATALVGTASGLVDAASQWGALDWDLYPMPVWPTGRWTFGSSDFYAIWSGTAYPDVAWDLVKYLCVGSKWQRFMMKLALVGPNQPALFPDWLRAVRAVAPALRRKRLEVLVESVLRGELYVGASLRYREVASAKAIATYTTLAQRGQLDVPVALRQAAQAVDRLQAGGARSEARELALLREVELAAAGPLPQHLPPPPLRGSGTGPRPSPYARHQAGRWILLGDGAAMDGTQDSCIYACVPTTADAAEWTCRILALANLSCPTLSPQAAAGLMIRGDLGDSAAMLAVAVTAGNGVVLQVRPLAGMPLITLGPPATATPAGLIGAPFLTRPLYAWAPNYLLQPVWLRVRRQGATWTASTSLDGLHWAQAGATQAVPLVGAWVGVFACACNAAFADHYYTRATFDQLSFTPAAAYQLGVRGIPPAAGPVPPQWALV